MKNITGIISKYCHSFSMFQSNHETQDRDAFKTASSIDMKLFFSLEQLTRHDIIRI